jgi:predicted nucleic acid-binding protein
VSPARFLLDTSALVRLLRDPAVRSRWEQQIEAGLVAMCPLVELEVLYAARSAKHRAELQALLATAFVWVSMPDRVFTRAAEVQEILTQQGQHRSAGAVDLLVAATAELTSLTLVHYDRDFDQVARASGQTTMWLAPAGSIN